MFGLDILTGDRPTQKLSGDTEARLEYNPLSDLKET
jgi:hypothetical protein